MRDFIPLDRDREFTGIWSMIDEGARYLQPCAESALLQHVVLADPRVLELFLKNRPPRTASAGELALIEMVSRAQDIWHQWRWRRAGRLIYEVDPLLIAAFAATDAKVSTEDLPVPYPSLFIAAPEGMRMGPSGTKLEGWYVTEMDPVQIGGSIVIGGRRLRVLDRPVQGNVRVLRCLAAAATEDQAFFMPLIGAQSVDEWATNAVQDGGLAENVEHVKTWARVIAHTLLYISSVDADVAEERLIPDAARRQAERIPGRNAREKRLDRAAIRVRYFKVGSRLVFDEDSVRALSAPEDVRRVTSRFMVRGHWRLQAIGEGRQQRRLMWIRPHWKGPPWGDLAAARVVRVRAEQEVH